MESVERRQTIAKYRRLLETETDRKERERIIGLLIEEQLKQFEAADAEQLSASAH